VAEVVLRGLSKAYGRQPVLHGLDGTVADGELLVVLGPSGCGKSTLLRLIAGLEQPTAGSVIIGGRDVTALEPKDRDIAMVFQSYALYPHMSVFDNMAYGLRVRGMARTEIARRVDDAARSLDLSGLLDRKPRELSGGQRQRVAMGRAIVREPQLFLFDEPLSNLDAALRAQMRLEIRRLQRRIATTSIYVTHDQAEAMTLGDRLMVMRDGRIEQVGKPLDVYARPDTTFVAGFLGTPPMNLLPAEIRGGAVVLGGTVLAASELSDRRVRLGIRPEHLVADPAGLALAVELVEPLGAETLVHGRLNGAAVIVRLAAGDPVPDTVALPSPHLHLYDVDNGRRLG
jgi:sn-glycerol 3-phosphate transport system ATP-binding protein